jgi:hypothetical protein
LNGFTVAEDREFVEGEKEGAEEIPRGSDQRNCEVRDEDVVVDGKGWAVGYNGQVAAMC